MACFGSNARRLTLRGGLAIDQAPLPALKGLAPAPSLVLHLAFLTQERAKTMSDADYIAANESISGEVLAALSPIGAEGVFVASSGAAYLADQPGVAASMALYGRLKRLDEARFAAWASETGKRAVIARVFNLSGPYINKQSSYALACFIADALADRPIVIRAPRPVTRSYVAISELMSVAFGSLTDGGTGSVRFDTAGDRAYEMAEIAQIVAEIVGCARGISAPARRDGAPDDYVGDGRAYERLIERFNVERSSFPSQVLETARYMASQPGIGS